ncbi:MAG: esterase-like activity of phytase family protein [Paracoccaceae bacterium]
MRAAVFVLLLLANAVQASDWSDPVAEGRALSIRAEPVEIVADRLHPALIADGAWRLTSDDAAFGGLSGLAIRGGELLAVGDRGVWLRADIKREGDELMLSGARIAPLRGADGAPLATEAADAEALAVTSDGRLLVAFERDHRLSTHGGAGALAGRIAPKGFAALDFNGGIEGLAAFPDGRILALGESQSEDASPVFVLGPEGGVVSARLAAPSRHRITGADLSPTGHRLYTVARDFSRVTGVSIRIFAYHLDADGVPRADRRTELAAFESASGIDNMEALAVEPTEDGLRLWIVSDNNFNPPQRTILMAFRLKG